MNSSTKLSDRVWTWLACKVLPDSAFQNLCREDFDEEAFGETHVEWHDEHDEIKSLTLAPVMKTAIQ